MTELSIIILNFNTCDLLRNCLASIYNNTISTAFEVIVVDNGSTDKSTEMIKTCFPKAIIIENQKNLGYSEGNNLGIKKSSGRYILLLNSDTKIVGESLDLMVQFLKSHLNISILGPKLLYPDGKVQKSAGNFFSLSKILLMLFGGERLGLGRSAPRQYTTVDWVSGACLLVRREVFEKIGYFDQDFFMYMEEVEFCFRASLNDFKTGYFPQAQVIHIERSGLGKNKKFAILNIYKGLLLFYKKYKPHWQYLLLVLMLRIKAAIAIFWGNITNSNYLKSTYGEAFKFAK